MKSHFAPGKTFVFAVALAGAVQAASAVQVQYTYTGETGGGVIMGIHTSDYNGNARIGEFIMTTSNPDFQSTLLTYCTDVAAFLSTTYNYTPTPISSATGVSPVWISGGIQNVAKLWLNDKGSATTATQTAGLQLAIWELLYNNLGASGSYTSATFFNHSNNGFYITSDDPSSLAVTTYAAGLLNNFDTLPDAQNLLWLAPTSPQGEIIGSQGLLYETPQPQNHRPVPDASSTLALFGAALAGVTAAQRKFFKA